MEEHRKYFYAKFKMDKRLKTMEGIIISEDKNRVDQWKKGKERKILSNDDKDSAYEDNKNTFASIFLDFEKQIDVFQETVPFIMRSSPLMLRFSDDKSIRSFTKEHGECLENGEYETYRISVDHAGELSRRMAISLSIQSGLNSLPNMFIVGLVSAYDVFLSNIIREIFSICPEILSSSEKNISFRDLVEKGSVDAVRQMIIEKEVETVMRSSHADQIAWLERKIKIPTKIDEHLWPSFIEICEFRNLLTHTGGVVSSQYLTICTKHGADINQKVIGRRIDVNQKYYAKAVQVISEFGSKLAQVIWRKLVPNEIELADNTLNDFSYRLITKRRYHTAATILKFGLEMKKHGQEATRVIAHPRATPLREEAFLRG
jgi:hypothetical protein